MFVGSANDDNLIGGLTVPESEAGARANIVSIY